MRELLATVTSKGQVTIPVEVRRRLGLKAKDKIAFIVDNNEKNICIGLPRYQDIASLRGAAGSLKKPLSWEKMREVAREDRLRAKDTGGE